MFPCLFSKLCIFFTCSLFFVATKGEKGDHGAQGLPGTPGKTFMSQYSTGIITTTWFYLKATIQPVCFL